jgi:hypothetical protein
LVGNRREISAGASAEALGPFLRKNRCAFRATYTAGTLSRVARAAPGRGNHAATGLPEARAF